MKLRTRIEQQADAADFSAKEEEVITKALKTTGWKNSKILPVIIRWRAEGKKDLPGGWVSSFFVYVFNKLKSD